MRISDWSSYVCSSDLSPSSPSVGCGRCPTNHVVRAKVGSQGPMIVRPASDFSGAIWTRRIQPILDLWAFHAIRPVRHGVISTRSEEHTSELQSLMRISYAVFGLKKKNKQTHSIRN